MAKPVVSRAARDTKPSQKVSKPVSMAAVPAETKQRPTNWPEAIEEYRALRAITDTMPLDSPDGAKGVDAYCEAMDHLVENVRAPDAAAFQFKIELAKERWDGFTVPHDWLDGLAEDFRHMSAGTSSRGHIEAMHEAWEAANAVSDANDRLAFRAEGANNVARNASFRAGEAADYLSRAILLTAPRTEADAAWLLLHLDLAIDFINANVIQDGDPLLRAMQCASSSLLDWHLKDVPMSGWAKNVIKISQRRTVHLRGDGAA